MSFVTITVTLKMRLLPAFTLTLKFIKIGWIRISHFRHSLGSSCSFLSSSIQSFFLFLPFCKVTSKSEEETVEIHNAKSWHATAWSFARLSEKALLCYVLVKKICNMQ